MAERTTSTNRFRIASATAAVGLVVLLGAAGCRHVDSSTPDASTTATTAVTTPASPTDSSSAPVSTETTTTAPNVSQPTDDIEADLHKAQSQLDQAQQDLNAAQTESTTDTRG